MVMIDPADMSVFLMTLDFTTGTLIRYKSLQAQDQLTYDVVTGLAQMMGAQSYNSVTSEFTYFLCATANNLEPN